MAATIRNSSFPGWGARVHLNPGQSLEVDLPLLHRFDDPQQIGVTATHPIEPPDHDGVAGAGVAEGLFPVGAVILEPTHRVGVELIAISLLQGVQLEVQRLLVGGDPGIPNLHRASVSQRHAIIKVLRF